MSLCNKDDEDNEQENPETKSEGSACENECTCFLRADQKRKQTHEDAFLLTHPQELYFFVKDFGLMWSQELIRTSLTQQQKKLIALLRHGDVPRKNDGMIEFWRLLDIGFMKCGQAKWLDVEAIKKDFSIVLTRHDLGTQDYSRCNIMVPSLQNNVLIPNNFFENVYHTRMCDQFTLHHEFSIDTETVFFLLVDPWTQNP